MRLLLPLRAFGVGVDRVTLGRIIHTYIPQNANTYYQELGRGGETACRA